MAPVSTGSYLGQFGCHSFDESSAPPQTGAKTMPVLINIFGLKDL